MNSIISVKELTVKYGRNAALENVSFELTKGDYIGVAGPNGSGKTTLFKSVLGLIKPSSGSINIIDKHGIAIGYLPQKSISSDILFPATVKEIVLTGLPEIYKSPLKSGLLFKNDSEKIDRVLDRLGISELKNKRVGSLSGGQHQRVLLARALIGKPSLLLLDEPVSALDPVVRDEFFNLLNDLNKNDGVTIMLVSHDISTIGKYTSKILYLDTRLVFFGSYKQFCESPDMTEYFGYNSQHQICWRHENGKCIYNDN